MQLLRWAPPCCRAGGGTCQQPLTALPAPLLQDGHAYIGDSYDNVAILFSDIVGFSTMASTMSAVEVFLLLTK